MVLELDRSELWIKVLASGSGPGVNIDYQMTGKATACRDAATEDTMNIPILTSPQCFHHLCWHVWGLWIPYCREWKQRLGATGTRTHNTVTFINEYLSIKGFNAAQTAFGTQHLAMLMLRCLVSEGNTMAALHWIISQPIRSSWPFLKDFLC